MERNRRTIWPKLVPDHSFRKLRSIPVNDIVTFVTHVRQVVERQRHIRIIDVVRRQVCFVVDNFAQLFMTAFADPAVDRLSLLNVCASAFLPCS